jgi:MFS family permease
MDQPHTKNICFETPPLTRDTPGQARTLLAVSSVSLIVEREKAAHKKTTTRLTRIRNLLTKANLRKALVILGSFIIYFMADGFSLSFGLFAPEFVKSFDRKNDEKSVFIIPSLIQAVPLFLSPLVCFMIKKFSCRTVALLGSTLYLLGFVTARYAVNSLIEMICTVSFLTSTGLAMIYIPAYLVISFHFNKRRALATGLAVSGSGLGMFAFSPVVAFLLTHFTWRQAWLIIGFICSLTFISAFLFDPSDDESTAAVDSQAQSERKQSVVSESRKIRIESKRSRTKETLSVLREVFLVFKTPNFVLIILSYLALSFSVLTPHNFLASHLAHEAKTNPAMADPSAWSMSLIGISTLLGQIIIGYVSDVYRSLNWLIFATCLILSGLCTCMVPRLTSIGMVYGFSVVYGFLTSVNYVLQSTLVIESGLGIDHLTMAFGCLQMTQGFTTLLGTPVLSAIKDQTGDYAQTFYLGGLLVSIAGVVMLPWPLIKRQVESGENVDEFDDVKLTADKRENMRLTVSTEVPI